MRYIQNMLVDQAGQIIIYRDRFKFCVNSKSAIRHINSYQRAQLILITSVLTCYGVCHHRGCIGKLL